jgi:hypothetical protein
LSLKKTKTVLKETGKKNKTFYKGYFNLGNEVIIRCLYAYSPLQAKNLMIRRIAREKGLAGMGGLFKVFDGSRDNYKIEEEPCK